MTRIITYLLIAGTSAAVHAAAASDTHNPLTTGYGPPVDQDWGIDSEPNNTHNPLTTGYGPPVE